MPNPLNFSLAFASIGRIESWHHAFMNSTSRLDRLITELRQQLAVSARAPQSRSQVGAPQDQSLGHVATKPAKGDPLSAVKALMGDGVSDEKVLVKRYVEELLKRDLSERIFNDAEFHRSLADLMDLLEEDQDAWNICLDCIRH